jgi:hypothetical protein
MYIINILIEEYLKCVYMKYKMVSTNMCADWVQCWRVHVGL